MVVIWEVVLDVEELLLESDGGIFRFWKVWLILALLLVASWCCFGGDCIRYYFGIDFDFI